MIAARLCVARMAARVAAVLVSLALVGAGAWQLTTGTRTIGFALTFIGVVAFGAVFV